MERYIALLRGINVGGKNKVSMPILKSAFEEIGLKEVKTYINSGNIVFSSDIVNKHELSRITNSIINDTFKLDIPVVIISLKELTEIIDNAPDWWVYDKEIVNYVIFTIYPTSVDEVVEAVGDIDPQYEKIEFYNDIIYWSTPLGTFSKARWSKIASSSVNNKVTIRNVNTINKLFQLASNI